MTELCADAETDCTTTIPSSCGRSRRNKARMCRGEGKLGTGLRGKSTGLMACFRYPVLRVRQKYRIRVSILSRLGRCLRSRDPLEW